MATEKMPCGCLTRVYGDAGHRVHMKGCPLELEFTEAQLRAVLDDHGPTAQECDMCGPHIVCTCDWRTDFTADHLIEELKKLS